MTQDKRKQITDGASIIEWAKLTHEKGGELFTALNKAEQLLIADFILGMDEYIRQAKSTEDKAPTQQEDPKQVDESPSNAEKAEEESEAKEPVGGEEDHAVDTKQKITNAEYFRREGTGAQVAYGVFRRRVEANPDLYGIFENGKVLIGASFAYWLGQYKE